nr:MAG TPA: hypothetical protein [Caudoviricetes sp.]
MPVLYENIKLYFLNCWNKSIYTHPKANYTTT